MKKELISIQDANGELTLNWPKDWGEKPIEELLLKTHSLYESFGHNLEYKILQTTSIGGTEDSMYEQEIRGISHIESYPSIVLEAMPDFMNNTVLAAEAIINKIDIPRPTLKILPIRNDNEGGQ